MKGNTMKTITTNHRTTTRRGLRPLTVLGATLAVLVTGACGGTETAKPSAGGTTPLATPVAVAPAVFEDGDYLQNAGDYIDAAKERGTPKRRP